MTSIRRARLLLAVLPLLAGCDIWQNRAEFAPPDTRWNAEEPSPMAKDAPPAATATEHCYRTLAEVDCFTARQANRAAAYTGSYPEN